MSKLKTRRKNHYRYTNSSPDEYEFDSQIQSSTCGMLDGGTSACNGLTLDRSCSACSRSTAMSPTSTGLSEGFFVGLKDGVAWHQLIRCQVTRRRRSWQVTRLCSAEEEEGHRKRAYGKDGVKRRQLWRSLRRFWQILQPGAFFLWKQCTLNYCFRARKIFSVILAKVEVNGKF